MTLAKYELQSLSSTFKMVTRHLHLLKQISLFFDEKYSSIGVNWFQLVSIGLSLDKQEYRTINMRRDRKSGSLHSEQSINHTRLPAR